MTEQDVMPALGQESISATSGEVSVGQQLRQAREARNLAVADIARTLKLGQRQVEALENGNWQGLPGVTFIRGFVRNYARLVGVDAAPLMVQLDQSLTKPTDTLDVAESRPTRIYTTGSSASRKNRQMVVIGAIILSVAGLIYFLLPNDLSALRDSTQAMLDSIGKKGPSAEASSTVVTAGERPEPVFPPGTTPQQVMNPQLQVPAEEKSPEPLRPAVPVEAKPEVVAPKPGLVVEQKAPQIRFVITKDSWVEVRDRDNKVVFSQRMAGGAEQSVSGQGPLSLVLGYAPGVQLYWHGEKVDLVPHTKGDVARLVLE